MKCYDCGGEIRGVVVWLGEDYRECGGDVFEAPFHERCADQPWPLYEIRRTNDDQQVMQPETSA